MRQFPDLSRVKKRQQPIEAGGIELPSNARAMLEQNTLRLLDPVAAFLPLTVVSGAYSRHKRAKAYRMRRVDSLRYVLRSLQYPSDAIGRSPAGSDESCLYR